LKDQLDQINSHLNHKETRKVYSVGYHHLTIDSNGSV